MPEPRRVRVISRVPVGDALPSTDNETLEISVPSDMNNDIFHSLREYEYEFEEEATDSTHFVFDSFNSTEAFPDEIFIPERIDKKEELKSEIYILFSKIKYMNGRMNGEYSTRLTRMYNNLHTLVRNETINNIDNYVLQEHVQPPTSLPSIFNRNEATLENWQRLLIDEFKSINEIYDKFSDLLVLIKKYSDKSYTSKLIVNNYMYGQTRGTPDKPEDGVFITVFKAIVRKLT